MSRKGSYKNWPDMAKMKNFTEDEVNAAKEGFDLFEKGNQVVMLDEMLRFLEASGINEKYPTVYSIISKIAEVNPKGVNFKNFMEAYQGMLGNVDTKAGLQRLFESLDIDENQYLDADRIGNLAKEIGENISRDDVEYLIEEGYNCPNGKVDSDAFVKMVLKVGNR
jgi:Ca2+-binding EF-hand superfamily protein